MTGRSITSSNSTASSSQVTQSMTGKASSSKRKDRSQNILTGKKGTTSSNSGIHKMDITEEDMAIYKAIQAKLKAEKKAAAASHEEGKFLIYFTTSRSDTQALLEIRRRNKRLMDEETNDDGGDNEPPPIKKKRILSATMVLDDEEAEIASGLCPIRRRPSVTQLEDGAGSQNGNSSGSEEEKDADDDFGHDAVNDFRGDAVNDFRGDAVDDFRGDAVDDVSGGGNNGLFEDNGISVSESTSSVYQRSQSQSVTPWLSSDSKAKTSNSGKVKESDFSPKTRRLAIASKANVRTSALYNSNGPFLPSSRLSRMDFAWTTIKDTSKSSNDPMIMDALSRASNNDATKHQLIKFTMYGRSALISNVVTKARERVRGFYGLNGTADKIKEDVEWLLSESKFMYADIDLEKHTYNRQKPFGTPLIIEIIESQWFSTSSRSNLDVATTAKIVEEKAIPLSIIILILTVIEHSLKEWSNGRKANKISFSEDLAKQSYAHHLGNWNALEQKAPRWAKFWQKGVVEQILSQHNEFLEEANHGKDIADLDFAALDKLVDEVEAGEH